MAYLDPFDARGSVRRDFSEDEIALIESFSEEHKAAFFDLLGASNEEHDADQELADALQNETACNRALAVAEEFHHRNAAPRTFLQELRAVQNRPKY